MVPIRFEKVSKTYHEKVALQDITLEFAADATTAVIGPSGSGKSTLLQLINGLIRPEAGRVFVFGSPIDYDDLPALRRRIGYAVQGTGLFPHLTVEKNISLLAVLQGWEPGRISERVRELMQLVDLAPEFCPKFPHELSGGEQQRVGLCRAMMLDPPIFLLDEAFGALDPITRSEIHREFIKLQRLAARTIVVVTHDLREAIKLADRIVILNHGQIEQKAAPRDLLAAPATRFVEEFVHTQLEDDVTLPAT